MAPLGRLCVRAKMTYQCLDVETLGGLDVLDILFGEGTEDRSLSGVVEAENQDSGFTLFLFKHAKLAEESHIIF